MLHRHGDRDEGILGFLAATDASDRFGQPN